MLSAFKKLKAESTKVKAKIVFRFTPRSSRLLNCFELYAFGF